MLRQKVFYRGNVQGVGFRQSAAGIAKRFAVQGWVRNLPDGGVELAVEGEAAEVNRFLAEVRREAPGRIASEETLDWTAPLPKPGFQIRFDLNP